VTGHERRGGENRGVGKLEVLNSTKKRRTGAFFRGVLRGGGMLLRLRIASVVP